MFRTWNIPAMPAIARYKVYAALIVVIVVLTHFYIRLSKDQNDLSIHFKEQNDFLNEAEEEQRHRKKVIQLRCQFLKINKTLADIPTSYLDHFIVDDEHQLIYCFVPKVACTNWKKVLLTLQHSEAKDPLSISRKEANQANAFRTLRQYSPEEIRHRLDTYWKFTFVRHPHERLLSAYRDKIQDPFGTEIVKRFRTNPSRDALERGHDVTFVEFVRYVTSLSTADHKRAFNEHWRPEFDLCFPCHVRYDAIGKYETLEADAQYVLEKIGFAGSVRFPSRFQTYKKKPTRDVMQTNYRNISTELHRKMFEIYMEDFILFQYEL